MISNDGALFRLFCNFISIPLPASRCWVLGFMQVGQEGTMFSVTGSVGVRVSYREFYVCKGCSEHILNVVSPMPWDGSHLPEPMA